MSSSKRKKHTVVSKPVLEYEETDKGDILVRLHDDDTEFKQDLYRWIAYKGLSVHKAKDEFSLMGRVQIPAWFREKLAEDFELVLME